MWGGFRFVRRRCKMKTRRTGEPWGRGVLVSPEIMRARRAYVLDKEWCDMAEKFIYSLKEGKGDQKVVFLGAVELDQAGEHHHADGNVI